MPLNVKSRWITGFKMALRRSAVPPCLLPCACRRQCHDRMAKQFAMTYTDADGHSHVHGANLGIGALAYLQAGGIQGLEASKDVALLEALKQSDPRIAWSCAPRVATSARPTFRVLGGFGATPQQIEQPRALAGAELGIEPSFHAPCASAAPA